MKDSFNQNYLFEVVEKLLKTPSPSGYCHQIMDLIKEMVHDLGYSMEFTQKGCGVITIPGLQPDYTLGLSAHVDTLGAMVRSIKPSGMIRFTPIGGYMMSTVEGEYCTIHTRSGKEISGTVLSTQPSVHVYANARSLEREEANMEIRLDEAVFSKEEVDALGIGVGDFISFDSRTVRLDNGYIKSRHLDDKAGVAILLGLLEWLQRTNTQPQHNLVFFISTYEEIGHGASYIPAEVNELLAIDMGAMGDDLTCTEKDVSICVKDSSGPYDYHMVSHLQSLAKENQLSYAMDVYPYYGSDVSAALRGGQNIRGALIGPGVHASHGVERTHIDGMLNTLALLVAYVQRGA